MQYSCKAFQELLRRHALVPSMSRKEDCWDNAVAESFFSHLRVRVIEGRSFWDERELRRVVFEYIEIHYARERKHSSNGWNTPQKYENEFVEKLPRTHQLRVHFFLGRASFWSTPYNISETIC